MRDVPIKWAAMRWVAKAGLATRVFAAGALLFGAAAARAAGPVGLVLEDELLSADQAFRVLTPTREGQTFEVSWDVADGYYLYRDAMTFEVLSPAGFRLAPPLLPAGAAIQDPQFGPVQILRGRPSARFVLPPGLKGALALRVRHQVCSDTGLCYPPQQLVISVDAAPPSLPPGHSRGVK